MKRFLSVWASALLCACLLAGGPVTPPLENLSVYSLLDLATWASQKSLDSAFVLNNLALRKAISAKDWEAVFYTLRERGIYYEKFNMPAKAVPEYEKALAILDSISLKKNDLLPIALNDLAIVSRKCGRYNDCLRFHEQALKLALANRNLELEEDSYHGIGFLYETVGEWDKANSWYQKSVEVAEKRKNQNGIVITFQNIANVLQKSGNTELALQKIEEAWQLAQKTDSTRRAHVLHDYGQILAATGHYNEALAKFQTSLVWYENLGDRPMVGRSLLNMADTYAQKGDEGLALEFFRKSLELKDAIRPEDLVKLWQDLGELHLGAGNLAAAELAFDECLALAGTLNFRDFLQKAHHSLAQVHEKKGDKAAAFEHLRTALSLADSLRDFEKERHILDMEFRYQAERREKTIQALQSRNSRIYLGIAAVFFLSLSGFLYFMFRQKVKHNELLDKKNAEIERRNQQLRESNEVLQQFAYATAHDLKEPLRTIGSFVGLLQKKHGQSFAPEANEYFEFVKAGAMRMNVLLTDLLEYSTVFMDGPGQGQTNVGQGLREIMSNLQDTIRRRGAVVELPVEMPRQPVAIQQSHFIQLFQNLIANAIKFSPENPHVALSLKLDQDGFFLFSVRDNGIGIENTYRDKIFQIFQRLERQRFEGAGIGLAICKNIVEKYGGSIWFESQVGRGTTFFVRLPAKVEAAIPMMAFHEN